MELIPVFAFIVLVASIATFIFSLAAYMLYKIREKRGRYSVGSPPKAFKAELVAPNYYYLPHNDALVEETNKIARNAFSAEEHLDSINENNNNLNDRTTIDEKNGNELAWK